VEYGWIVRGAHIRDSQAFGVRRFHEKPSAPIADDLFRTGGLWNTFISTGPVTVFWELARKYLADHVTALERYAASIGAHDESAALAAAYRGMTEANFSRDVLAHATDAL